LWRARSEEGDDVNDQVLVGDGLPLRVTPPVALPAMNPLGKHCQLDGSQVSGSLMVGYSLRLCVPDIVYCESEQIVKGRCGV